MGTEATDKRAATDVELLRVAAAGDVAGFEQLYRLYAQRVFQYVHLLVGDPATAEEVVGDTMVAVWRGAGSFSHGSRVSTWILGIARHKALDALRRAGRQRYHVTLEEAMHLANSQDGAVEELNRKQQANLTQQALSMLSPEHQEILRLVFYEELPYDEIGVLLSIPTNTVKTRVFYAKQQLKKRLEQLSSKEAIR